MESIILDIYPDQVYQLTAYTGENEYKNPLSDEPISLILQSCNLAPLLAEGVVEGRQSVVQSNMVELVICRDLKK